MAQLASAFDCYFRTSLVCSNREVHSSTLCEGVMSDSISLNFCTFIVLS